MNDETPKLLNIVVAQLNFWVGDVARNLQTMIEAVLTAKSQYKADLIVFPELALSGYPPEDLLFRAELHVSVSLALEEIAKYAQGIDILVGYPEKQDGHLYNAAIWFRAGKPLANYRKQRLPNYGVFDESRYFSMGEESCVVSLRGVSIGVLICEDIWYPEPVAKTVSEGAECIICLNASPFHIGKVNQRTEIILERISEQSIPLLYVHGVGGQDELIFDGGSMLFDAQGKLCQRAPCFKEALISFEFSIKNSLMPVSGKIALLPTETESAYQALVLGVQDYVKKNGFSGVLIGLSGGIDSALTLAIAVDALGAQSVQAVLMPSRYTAAMSIEDAIWESSALGVEYLDLSIESVFEAFLKLLAEPFADRPVDITEENLQARCRGMILMALSNKTGKLVLTTGNKSEMAVGYATLYGDMAGGFDVLKDVSKTRVYALARYRNDLQQVIPSRVLARPPSAELAFHQKDEDTLPPYSILDEILACYVEKKCTRAQLVEVGFPEVFIDETISRLHRNEYKRRQAPCGIRITPLAFGRDWRYPITAGVFSKSSKVKK